MTREGAITTLKEMHESFDEIHENTNWDIGYEQMTALDMAIEALQADVVSREEAIQAIDKCRERKNKEIEQLREFYSQNPTIPMFKESEEAYKAWTGEDMGGGRLIDADALKIKIEEELYSNDYEEHIYQIIDNAPTVSADRPQGEWEHTEEVTTMDGLHWHIWRCTNCNSSGNPDMNFCPNCGAKMGGDVE